MATTSVGGITVQLDMYGSTMDLGVDSNRRDRAVRRALVSGLTGSVNDGDPAGGSHTLMQRAAQAVFDAVGLFHHTITDLRLQDIHTRPWGQTKVWVDLIYFRGFENTGFLSGPSGGTFEYTTTISDVIPVYRHVTEISTDGIPTGPSFDAHGLPSGPMLGNSPKRLENQNQLPPFKMWDREATLISVPTVLSSHPYSVPGVASLIGHVNSDVVTIGSIGFTEFTLKFRTTHVKIRFGGHGSGPGSVKYDTTYEFVAIDLGHYSQAPTWIPEHLEFPDGKGPPVEVEAQWGTVEAVEFPALPFVGAFPLAT